MHKGQAWKPWWQQSYKCEAGPTAGLILQTDTKARKKERKMKELRLTSTIQAQLAERAVASDSVGVADVRARARLRAGPAGSSSRPAVP